MLLTSVSLAGLNCRVHAEPVPREQVEDAIREGCRRIIGTQKPNGAIVLDIHFFQESKSYVFPVGETALGVLALQHALPHLNGDDSVKAREAVQKGLAYISQHRLEPLTYSAGLVISALYKADPRKYRKLIGKYAEMLVISQQKSGRDVGFWGYFLRYPKGYRTQGKEAARALGRGDHSNTQIAVLGLYYAHLSRLQIPRKTWLLLMKHFIDFQNQDGGWHYGPSYSPKKSTANMTLTCTISLDICYEMLEKKRKQCKRHPGHRPVEMGLKWVSDNLDYDQLETYGFYATERLGILSGYSEFGGKSWFDEGAARLVKNRKWPARNAHGRNQQVGAAFAVLFLSRGLEPIIINKLKRTGDWRNHLRDVKHLVEYISTRYQKPKQWRIVTLEADVDFLLRVPALWISGHDKLIFTDVEKAKLKEYVERGGTIFAEDCCSKKPFDKSFRGLLAELWPDAELQNIPKKHMIYTMPRRMSKRPKIMGMAVAGQQAGYGIVYLPHGISCNWERGGSKAKSTLDIGANICFYIEKARSRVITVRKTPETPVPE